jgi:UDP-glucose 4-epimerase
MKVLITGGDGFLGTRLSKKLNQDYEISISVRSNVNVESGVGVCTGDLCTNTDWSLALSEVSSVVHLASEAHKPYLSYREAEETNIFGLTSLLKACENTKVKRFIYISTAYVHGKSSNRLINEHSPLCLDSGIIQTRIIAEEVVRKLCKNFGIDYVIIRPALILEYDSPGNIKSLTNMISKLHYLPFKNIKNKRSYVSIDKLINFIESSLDREFPINDTFLLANKKTLSLKELIVFLANGNTINIRFFWFPKVILRHLLSLLGHTEKIPVLFGDFQIDSSKAEALLKNKRCVK